MTVRFLYVHFLRASTDLVSPHSLNAISQTQAKRQQKAHYMKVYRQRNKDRDQQNLRLYRSTYNEKNALQNSLRYSAYYQRTKEKQKLDKIWYKLDLKERFKIQERLYYSEHRMERKMRCSNNYYKRKKEALNLALMLKDEIKVLISFVCRMNFFLGGNQ
eukprot:TRINITY_DN6600_c0_g1_i3.p1 TRINITY_DN6600_c0_g1~~TRINITY_DN6600_c0_g1_i3.p1  ORF type:complete len:160 (-),score=11.39 TRINITY_DN6600_c0_g1_i3:915-1394(-)